MSGSLDSSNQSSKLSDIHCFLALSNRCVGGIVVIDDDCKEEDRKLPLLIRALSPNIFDKRCIKRETIVVQYPDSEEYHPIGRITICISNQAKYHGSNIY